ncbi:MAG TPA: DUF3800 domain-containing protein [Thermoanaerobaculia bacterium]
MQFVFDESGSFTVPREQTHHRVGVVVGVAIADHVRSELERRFRDFTSTLERHERVNGEPKGARLCAEHQKAFGNLLRRFRHGIMVTPVTLDLSMLVGTPYASPGAGMAAAVRDWIPRMKHEPPKQRMEELARQMENLSDNQALRAFALAYCFRQILEYAMTLMAHGEFAASWEDLEFVVDRVHKQANSREEQVFTIAVMSWLSAWIEIRPIGLIQEIHTASHPIVRKYVLPEGLELGSLMRDRIRWENSAASWGLQVADMAAAIIGAAVQDPTNTAAARAFVGVMRASHLSPSHALNVFSPDPDVDESSLDKYQPLGDALATDQRRRQSR